MFIVGILSWWYGAGLITRISAVRGRIASIMDYFSIDLLLRTIFSPFKQISAGGVAGSMAQKWRALVDRLFSRCIGAVVRLLLIIVGVVGIIGTIVIGTLLIVAWLFVPVLPLVGVILTLIGWTPSWT
jgi:hypothetical protein